MFLGNELEGIWGALLGGIVAYVSYRPGRCWDWDCRMHSIGQMIRHRGAAVCSDAKMIPFLTDKNPPKGKKNGSLKWRFCGGGFYSGAFWEDGPA